MKLRLLKHISERIRQTGCRNIIISILIRQLKIQRYTHIRSIPQRGPNFEYEKVKNRPQVRRNFFREIGIAEKFYTSIVNRFYSNSSPVGNA